MKIPELSTTTGVPLSTIEMYLREALLQPGEKAGPDQASYGEEHMKRVRMVNGLIGVGGMSVAAAREVVVSITDRYGKAETVVLGDVLGDALFAGLRRSAQEHVSNTRYAPEDLPKHVRKRLQASAALIPTHRWDDQ